MLHVRRFPGHTDVTGWTLERPVRRIVTDVAVVGSGAAGAPAAIAAARRGAEVTLIEREGTLGGISTGVLDTFYGFFSPGEPDSRIVEGIGGEVADRLVSMDAAFLRPNTYGAGTGITYNPEVLRALWEQLCTDAGVRLLMHSAVVEVRRPDRNIQEILVVSGSELITVAAKVFVDASGDAVVTHLAGGASEGWSEVGDPQALTVTFTVSPVDEKEWSALEREQFLDAIAAAVRDGYRLPRLDGSIHATTVEGAQFVHMTKVAGFDPRDPEALTRAEVEGRQQALEYQRFLRDRVPGFGKAHLTWMSRRIGIRESRRIRGRYWLEKSDVLEGRRFPDAIGRAAAPIEIHGGGSGTHWEFIDDASHYEIPFRCLLPVELDNVVVAGRCLSASHDAHASARNMAQCMAMGQAAGTAASLAVDRVEDVSSLDPAVLRAALVSDGVLLEESEATA